MRRFLALAAAIVVFASGGASAFDSHFGVGVGVVVPQDTPIEEAMGITGLVGLPTFDKHVQNQLFVDYWRKGHQFQANTPETTLSDLSFGFLFKYNFLFSKPLFRPYVGAGFGAHMYKGRNAPPGSPFTDKNELSGGWHALGGLAIRVNKAIDLTAEAQYIFSELDQFTGRVGVLIRTGTY